MRLACAEDDAQGELIDVLWDYELDRRILEHEGWADLARGGFDDPRYFAAFLNTLRWNTRHRHRPTLFQSPFRAGIQIDAYQLEPLRKALRLPRVNLFIADDVGLGKTIEAGLIARELLLRKRAKTIVVAAPPSVLEQWKDELEERFGLLFEILDRDYVVARAAGARLRRQPLDDAQPVPRLAPPARRRGLRRSPARLARAACCRAACSSSTRRTTPPRPAVAATPSTRSSRAPSATSARASSTGCSCRPRRTTATPTASRRCSRCSIRSASPAA